MKHLAALILLAVSSFAQVGDTLTVNVGQQMAFSATAEGTPPFTWQWSKNGVAIAGATNATYTIVSAATTDSGTYRAKATNSAGNADSNALVINVVVPVVAPKNVVASVVVTSPTQGANSGNRPRSSRD
jgi:Immunoglobulin I-set domain